MASVGRSIAAPSGRNLMASAQDFGVGVLGGGLMAIGSAIFGPLGFIAAPVLAGAVVKGVKGEILATLGGVAFGQALLSGGFGGGSASAGNDSVM